MRYIYEIYIYCLVNMSNDMPSLTVSGLPSLFILFKLSPYFTVKYVSVNLKVVFRSFFVYPL